MVVNEDESVNSYHSLSNTSTPVVITNEDEERTGIWYILFVLGFYVFSMIWILVRHIRKERTKIKIDYFTTYIDRKEFEYGYRFLRYDNLGRVIPKPYMKYDLRKTEPCAEEDDDFDFSRGPEGGFSSASYLSFPCPDDIDLFPMEGHESSDVVSNFTATYCRGFVELKPPSLYGHGELNCSETPRSSMNPSMEQDISDEAYSLPEICAMSTPVPARSNEKSTDTPAMQDKAGQTSDVCGSCDNPEWYEDMIVSRNIQEGIFPKDSKSFRDNHNTMPAIENQGRTVSRTSHNSITGRKKRFSKSARDKGRSRRKVAPKAKCEELDQYISSNSDGSQSFCSSDEVNYKCESPKKQDHRAVETSETNSFGTSKNITAEKRDTKRKRKRSDPGVMKIANDRTKTTQRVPPVWV